MDSIELCGQRILVELDRPKSITESGIIIPQEVVDKEKPTVGIVIKISADIENPEIQVGDKIFFERNSCTDIKIDRKPYALILIDSVIAKLENNEISS